MKQLLFGLFLATLFSACKKDEAGDISELPGEWRWTSSSSFGVTTTPQSTGRTFGFIFNTDSTCSRTGNWLTASSGTYTYDAGSLENNFRILLAADTTTYYRVSITGNILILDEHSPTDAPVHYFERVR